MATLTLYVNGVSITPVDVDPRCTLLSFLRETLALKGTKLGCGEGGCGACTVMLSRYDAERGKIRHFSANACLTPLCALDGFAVTTIEGIGGMKRGLHPVQERLASLHGSQCGFCTPGIVMSLYTQLRSAPDSTPHEIEECMDGNLCRCTGYRPIIDAARSLSNNKGEKGGCCMGKGGEGGCPCAEGLQHSSSEKIVSSLESLETTMQEQNLAEPIFPPALMRFVPRSLRLEKSGFTWYQPTTLGELLALKSAHPNARLVVGNTEVGIEVKFKNMEYPVVINPAHVGELKVLAVDSAHDGIRIGAAVTINALRDFILELQASSSSSSSPHGVIGANRLRGLVAMRDMLTWFASNQIRNVACVGGNIVTASPISDLNPMLIACGAQLTLISEARGKRYVAIKDFFLAYRKVDIQPDEILESVMCPFTTNDAGLFEFVVPLKQARRREDDISIVTGGLRVKLCPSIEQDAYIVQDFVFALGGMAPTTVSASRTAAAFIGQQWKAETLEALYSVLRDELSLPENVPGGQAEYRMALAASFLFRSYLSVTTQLQEALAVAPPADPPLPAAPLVAPSDRSAATGFVTSPKPYSRSEQNYISATGGLQTAHPVPHTPSEEQERAPVGQPIAHKSARSQVSGEAVYTDDIKLPVNALHAALVTSTKVHARIVSVDASAAEACPGFVAFYSAKDITGGNHIGAVIKDEEVFATEEVKHVGAIIGMVLADTHEQATHAARKVVIVYEDLPHVVSIEEAIAANSFYPDEPHVIASGDLAAQEAEAEIIVSGTGKIGGQEHFYLETNCTLAVPMEHGQMEIFSSTQNPTKTQNFCAYVCGIPAAQVVCRCKRMGGAFGGKETRSVFIAVTAALGAHLTGRAVSINVERDLDMSITGQRHAFMVNYRAGCDRQGKLKFMDAQLYNNAGFSLDLSQAIMDRALFHCDNTYKWPAFRARGTLCRTNQPTHTAFRGFGGPQGMMLTEMALQHLASAAGIDIDTMRERNLYSEGDVTHFGQRLEAFHVPALWQRIKTTATLAERRAAIATFNTENRWKKRGLAVLPTKFGINFTAKFMNQGGALVHVYVDGTVLISHGGTEMGQGLHTKMIQIAARSFGIPDTLCHIMETATNAVANSSPTAASMSTDLYGMAVLDACEQILERLKPVRAKLAADATWASLINAAFFDRVNLSAQGFYAVATERCGYDWGLSTDDNSQRGQPFNYFTQGVACTEVEIDCLTGDSRLLRVDVLMDVGKSINPALDVGQIEGAFIQGYGWCTMEELVWGDSAHPWVRPGNLFTKGPGTYKIPAFNDVPEDFRIHLFDAENKYCVHSSKAVGEPPFFLGCSSFFAIRDAIQAARLERGLTEFYPLHSPVTSERIRMACVDEFTSRCVSGGSAAVFQPKASV